jgi:hypothetical protein
MPTLTYAAIQKLVAENNKSAQLSDEFIICLIWKESDFRDTIPNETSTAIGLMQITKGVIGDVNKFYKTAFTHAEMTDPAKNIQCGTQYLDLRIKWAKNATKGIEGYGTGVGYAKSIFACEKCLQSDREHWSAALYKIHQ